MISKIEIFKEVSNYLYRMEIVHNFSGNFPSMTISRDSIVNNILFKGMEEENAYQTFLDNLNTQFKDNRFVWSFKNDDWLTLDCYRIKGIGVI